MIYSSIFEYDLFGILNVDQDAEIHPQRVSTGTQYDGWEISKFIILPDGETIIGVNGINDKELLTENITEDKEPDVLKTHKKEISSISSDGVSRILVGDHNSCLTVFKFDIQTRSITIKYVYTNLGIKKIRFIVQLGHLAVVGGDPPPESKYQKQCLQIIDLQNRISAKHIQQTAEKAFIASLELWRKSKSELVLHVCGTYPDFSTEDSLLFDMSHAMKLNLVSSSQGFSKKVAVIEMGKIK
jgi:WD40 repeat protein